MTQAKRWQDAVNAGVGVWLVLSPWALGYSTERAAMTNAAILGLALIAVALGAVFAPHAWEEWTESALGLWLIASPWLLGFSAQTNAMRNAVVTGLVVLALALWARASGRQLAGFNRDRPAH